MQDLSATLAAHVIGVTYDDLSPSVVEATKRSLLDALGVMLGASGIGEGCGAFVDMALAAEGRPESSILGFQRRAPAHLAALANGALAHALDYEDAHDGGALHPNAAMIPAALAIAEARGGVSGKDFLTALAVGCDLVCRIGLCVKTPVETFGWYPPPMFGAYGATAAAARLMGLTADQVIDAFSLTLCQSTCSGEIKYSPNSVMRAVRDAFAAQAGVMSADLARRGVKGFDHPFEGRSGFFALYAGGDYDLEILTGGLGARFHGEDVSLKAWPSCRGTHAYIEAGLELLAEHGITAADVAHIHMGGASLQMMLMEPVAQKQAPSTAIDAKFSLPFTVASALIRGAVTLDDFDGAALADARVLELAARTSYEVLEGWGADRAASGRLTLTLMDGRVLSRQIDHALGHPSNPVDRPRLEAKFRDCAARAACPPSAEEVERLIAAVFNLEAADDAGRALAPRE